MAKEFDPQILNTAFLGVMSQGLAKMAPIVASEEPKVKAVAIEEYNGRMRISPGIEKLKSTSYISVVNFYINQGDLERHKPKGAMVFYLELENAGKFFKSQGIAFAEDEDDKSMMDACGKWCAAIAGELKSALSSQGYVPLVLSAPQNYKNNVVQGVEFSSDQMVKQEITFSYFKHPTIVVELTMAPLPKK